MKGLVPNIKNGIREAIPHHELVFALEDVLIEQESYKKDLLRIIDAAKNKNKYTRLKNKFTLELESSVKKAGEKMPTVQVITALYQDKYADEREAYTIAEAEGKVAKDLWDGVEVAKSAIQTLLNQIEKETR